MFFIFFFFCEKYQAYFDLFLELKFLPQINRIFSFSAPPFYSLPFPFSVYTQCKPLYLSLCMLFLSHFLSLFLNVYLFVSFLPQTPTYIFSLYILSQCYLFLYIHLPINLTLSLRLGASVTEWLERAVAVREVWG